MRFVLFFLFGCSAAAIGALAPANLRVEWLPEPLAVEAEKPRLSWRVEESDAAVRGQVQTAHRVIVAASAEALSKDAGDLWDGGKVASGETLNIEYSGKPLASGQACFWKVKVWDTDVVESAWSRWLLGREFAAGDWKARISFKDDTPSTPTRRLLRRRSITGNIEPEPVKRATHLPRSVAEAFYGQRIGEAYFESGWADYRQRSLYRAPTHETSLHRRGVDGRIVGVAVATAGTQATSVTDCSSATG